MGFYFLDATARSAWAAATTQLGQLEGLAALWSGNLSARFYSAAGAHLVTVTYGPWVVDMTTTPYSLYPGTWAAESHVQDGTAAYVVLAVPSGSDILRADVSLSGAISDPGGRVRVDIGTTLRIQATASLPAGGAPGTLAVIGTVALTDHINTVRENMGSITGETEAQVDTRMGGTRATILDYCGMVISADGRYVSFPISAGHSTTADDGFYQYDLQAQAFVYPPIVWPSQYGVTYLDGNEYGEHALSPSGYGRPADQHSYSHNVVVGDNIVQAMGYGVTVNANAVTSSRQAHIWRASTGQWERYGSLSGSTPGQVAHCFHDTLRNRIVRITSNANNGNIDTIPDNLAPGDVTTAWTTQTITSSGGTYVKWLPLGNSRCMGYHPTLDCYVVVAPGDALGGKRVRVMDAADITAGWTEATGSDGVTPPTDIGEQLLLYVPPLDGFALASPNELNKLYYLRAPVSGVITDPWTWESETFTGATGSPWGRPPSEKWIESRLQWSPMLGGLVAFKNATSPPEVFFPTI